MIISPVRQEETNVKIACGNIKKIRFETKQEIQQRVTATRIALLGVYALAFKKNETHNSKYLSVEMYENKNIDNVSTLVFSGKNISLLYTALCEFCDTSKDENEKLQEEGRSVPTNKNYIQELKELNLPEYVKPKNVGLMFFSMEPDKFFPYTQIDVVQFPDGLGGDNIIENTFKGPIHQQLRDALQFIKNTIITERVVKHPDRAEADRFFNYPYAAIEEALSNAVYHRAYDVREPIEVRVERDRIEIVSFPGPDRSVTKEGLKNYRVSNRRYRNRRIGDFLKELHLTEGRNTGFKKILNALDINGSPKPEFETDDDRSYFITRLFIHEGFLKVTDEVKESLNNSDILNKKIETETSFETSLKQVLKQKDYKKVELIVKKLANEEMISIQEVLDLTHKSRTMAWRYMQILVECGAVEAVGNTNNVSYKRL